ncbi:MAG: serine hydrolase [candidate division WOR-3 bacterium]|nr:MAG: serine hydrolase [candidate division WOR-3 bacterium]
MKGMAVVALAVSALVGCIACSGCKSLEFVPVDYTPQTGGDWEVSTPAAEGLDPTLVDVFYSEATYLPTLYGLLVVKNGKLIAEKYFNEGSIGQLSGRQSTTKSFTSACVGLAFQEGYLSSVDQKMMDFFPEYADSITDPRKNDITIRHLLQMRGGYPDEERESNYLRRLFYEQPWPPRMVQHLADFPLSSDPGAQFRYSNLSSHLLAVIVARACSAHLDSFAQKHLFGPMGAELGEWGRDADGYNIGCIEIYVRARDMAKFGLMYLNDGEFRGTRLLPAEWVEASLQRYSEGINRSGWFPWESKYANFSDVGYGYQWWSSRAGDHWFDYAAGHGGNLVVLLDDHDMVIVTTADPLYDAPAGEGWEYEGAIVSTVGRFIKSLPGE